MQVEKVVFETVNSTNSWAKEHLTKLKPNTLYVIRAEEQTAGYGRRGHEWISPKGKNLLLTFAFALTTEIPTLLTHRACLSLSKTLEEYSLAPQIKWPNDLFLNGKKIAGVLCEIVDGRAYLGFGLNVNMHQQELLHISPPATSLFMVTRKEFSRKELEQKLIINFLQTKFDKKEYERRLIFINQMITIEDERKSISGICEGVNEQGALILNREDGKSTIFSGHIVNKIQKNELT